MKKFLIIFVVIIVVLVAGRNVIVKFAIEKGAQAAAGVPLKIAKLDLGLITTQIGITELNVYNPKGFPKGVMFHSPEIFVDYNLGAILKGKIHIEDIRLDFDKFVIVTNEKGETNLDALRPEVKDETKKEDEKKGDAKSKKAPKIQIDHLSLKIGTVVFKDYSKGGEPKVTEYKINISEEINDVMDAQAILSFIMMKVIAKTGLSSLGNLGTGLVGGAASVPGEAVNTILGTTKTLTDKIKLPFGNK